MRTTKWDVSSLTLLTNAVFNKKYLKYLIKSFVLIIMVELDQRSSANTAVNKMRLDIFVLFNIFNYCRFASYSEFAFHCFNSF